MTTYHLLLTTYYSLLTTYYILGTRKAAKVRDIGSYRGWWDRGA